MIGSIPIGLRLEAGSLGFVLGAVIGAFLTVVVDRVPLGQSVVVPPSACRSCGRRLARHELWPMVSFLALRGRCRTCRAPIGWASFAIEAATAVLFSAFAAVGLVSAFTVWGFLLSVMAVSLSAVDLERGILPNRILGVGFLFAVSIDVTLQPVPPEAAALGGVVLGSTGLALALATGGLGMGDVKLLGLLGVFLGLEGGLIAFTLGAALGATYGVGRVLMRRGRLKDTIPFGPALTAAAVLTLFAFPAFAAALHLPIGGIWS